MASLLVLKGTNQGERLSLEGDRVVLGRSPDSNIVLPFPSVSRQHARFVRLQNRWHLEDMQSRNGTYVNGQRIADRVQVCDEDQIRIGEFLCSFQESQTSKLQLAGATAGSGEEAGGPGQIQAIRRHNSSLFLDITSADRLKAILAASNYMSKSLELDQLLPKIAESLFELFRQLDRCFIILCEEGSDQLTAKVIKTRRPEDENTARFSRSIVKPCLESLEAFLSVDAANDKRVAQSQSVLDFRIRSVMCVPLASPDGKVYGAILLDTQDRAKKFTKDDLELLQGVANQASIAIENARLYQDMQVREQMERDLELAGLMQRSILPEELPQCAGYEFFAHYVSAWEVGGDYYDFIRLSRQRLAITVGDVAGKGIPAALLMAKLSSDVRYCLLSESDPAVAMARLNDLILPQARRTDRFITLATAVLDPAAQSVTLINAGHLPPLLFRRASGTLQPAAPGQISGFPLGVQEGYTYASCKIDLQPGDTLLLFTDGIPDAVSVRNQHFEIKGIHAAMGDGPHSPRAFGTRIIEALEKHSLGRSPYDDVTLVCFGRTP